METLKGRRCAGLQIALAAIWGSVLAGCQPTAEQEAVAVPAGPPDLSGYWELRADSKRVPPAPVTEEGKKRAAVLRPDVDDGVILTHASRWCQHLGTPFIMGDSAPLNILQTKSEIGIIAEVQSAARHIYMDGRSMPSADIFDPTTNGFSIGRWEGDTLVVETQGFNSLGNPGIPGGGVRGPESKLTERYQLSDDGQQLAVTFTWDDPVVFTQSHTYEFVYYKAPPETYALEYFCDASDPLRPKTAEEPAQVQ